MGDLPPKAVRFLAAVYMVAVAALLAVTVITPDWAATPAGVRPHSWEFPLFLALGACAGRKKFKVLRSKRAEDAGSMSVGFAVTYAAMLRCGPDKALWVGMVTSVFAGLFPKPHPRHQLAFNVALTAIETWLAGFTFLALNGGRLGISLADWSQSVPAIAVSALVYFVVNTGAVATIIALCSGQQPYTLWKRVFLWTAPSYFASASIGAVADYLARDTSLITPLLFVAPIALFTYQSYKTWVEKAEEKQQHIEELQLSQAQLAELYLATIKSLALAIDAKDQYTHEHILRVQRYALATAREMGLSGGDLEAVKTGALLHDIGKMGVPEYVLLKPSPLTEEEFAKIRRHPEIGASILDPVPFPWPVVPVVRHHHERWDGNGYPDGLRGDEIPHTARIMAVADAYDAMTSSRSYRRPLTHEEAQARLMADAGTHFDPTVVRAFQSVVQGVVVEIERERGAPVAEQPPAVTVSFSKADQAALDIQRASSELWALYEVAQTLSSSLGIQETLEILARKLEAIFPGTAIVFMMRDDLTGLLMARSAVGVNRVFFESCRTVSSSSCSSRTVSLRETYLGEYDQADLLLNSAPGMEWVPLRSALIVPVMHEGNVLGTINLYHPRPDAFGGHDRQMLETIAERAAMALYNGILFERTRSHALTDPLTGLYNVRYLTQYVEERCSAATAGQTARDDEAASAEWPKSAMAPPIRRADSFAMLILDLDSFKPINDNFGHQKGDQVLHDLGRIFRATVRETDVVARYGGDEFLVVVDQAGRAEAADMAARLQEAVREYEPGLIHPRHGTIHLGASVGCACFPDDGQDCASLLSAADMDMYRNKTERKLGLLADSGRSHEPGEDEDLATAAEAA